MRASAEGRDIDRKEEEEATPLKEKSTKTGLGLGLGLPMREINQPVDWAEPFDIRQRGAEREGSGGRGEEGSAACIGIERSRGEKRGKVIKGTSGCDSSSA